jgi:hypothetical protein
MLEPGLGLCADYGVTDYCEPASRERWRSLGEYRDAIADYFVEFVRWLDIRPLWQQGDARFFRVNFWKPNPGNGQPRIARSVFLCVQETFDGLVVKETAE